MSNTAKLHEYIVAASSFTQPPVVGDYYVSQSGGTTFLLTKIRRMGGDAKPSFRLIGSRLRKTDLPPDITILPWPREQRGPSRAAEPAAMRPNGPIVTRAKKAKAERDRIVGIRKSYTDPANQIVEPIRVANKSAGETEIRDIDDLNPNRRQPRIVRTFKSTLVIDTLLKVGTISRRHARAATTFRNQYERASGLGLGQSDWAAVRSGGFGPGVGLSETQLFAMDCVREVRKLLGRSLWDIVVAVVVEDCSLREYGRRTRTNPTMCAGRFAAAVEVLSEHYNQDQPSRADDRATINTGQWNRPAEPGESSAAIEHQVRI